MGRIDRTDDSHLMEAQGHDLHWKSVGSWFCRAIDGHWSILRLPAFLSSLACSARALTKAFAVRVSCPLTFRHAQCRRSPPSQRLGNIRCERPWWLTPSVGTLLRGRRFSWTYGSRRSHLWRFAGLQRLARFSSSFFPSSGLPNLCVAFAPGSL